MTEGKKVDRFYVEKKDFSEFNRLKEKDTPFANSHNKDVFLAAMVVGYHEGCKIAIKSREGYFHEKDLLPREEALIRAMAVADTGSLSVLLDKQKVYSIAEQYATGGIALLKAKVFGGEQYGSYAKKLESELLRSYEKVTKGQVEKQPSPEELTQLSVIDLLKKGETDTLEFKASMIWDVKEKRPSKEMKVVIARTVASFMNSEGGILLIGVDDNGNVCGLADDLAQVHGKLDVFEQTFTNAINTYLVGGKVNRAYVGLRFEKAHDKDVAVATVKKSPRPVYVKSEGEREFCIRSGNLCQKLDVSEVHEYIEDHWPDLR